MYTVTSLGAKALPARSLTLHEAFMMMIGLTERAYRFTRTGRQMHLLLTNPPPDAPDFFSFAASDVVARDDIKRQVLAHGLGEFVVTRDMGGERLAAE